MRNQNYKQTAIAYAKSIFAIAKEHGRILDVKQELSFLVDVFSDRKIKLAVKNPCLSKNKLFVILQSLARNNLSSISEQFLKLIIFKRAVDLFQYVALEYEKLCSKETRVLKILVTAARSLDSEEIYSLKKALENKLQLNVILECILDLSLIGGIKLQVGDYVFDGSISGKLQRMVEGLYE